MRSSRTPRSFLVSVYSDQSIDPVSSCSWIDVQRREVFPFVTVFVVRVKRFNGSCVLRFGGLSLPVEQRIESDQRPIVRWFEKPSGDTQWSNGESASTNYFRLYQALSRDYSVDIVEPDQIPDPAPALVCICFGSCLTACRNQIWILSDVKQILSDEKQTPSDTLSATKQWEDVTITPTQSCSLSYKGKRMKRVWNEDESHVDSAMPANGRMGNASAQSPKRSE